MHVHRKVCYFKGEMNRESTNVIYFRTCMKCLEQHVGSAIKFKSRFRIHNKKLKRIVVRLLGTLIVNAVIPSIPLYICMSSSWREYITFMMTVILKIIYGTEKNIGTPNCLQM